LNLPLLLPPYNLAQKQFPQCPPLSQVFRTKLTTINKKKLSFGFDIIGTQPQTNNKKLSFGFDIKSTQPQTNNKKLSFGFDTKKYPTNPQTTRS